MINRLRTRLSFSHLLVLMIGMTLAGLLVWVAVENLYLSTQRENLLNQAQFTAWALEGTSGDLTFPEPYSQTTNVTPGIHTRLLSESGAVIIGVPFPEGDHPVQVPPALDPGYVRAADLLLREEMQSALNGEADTMVRTIEALDGQRVLYAAAPVLGPEGEVSSVVYLAMPLPPRGLPDGLIWKLVGAILAGSMIASMIGALLAGRVARPLEQLEKAAAKISRGNLNQSVPEGDSIQELAALRRSFNEMAESLRQSKELKDAFIADVTHELRTPLTVLKGTVETLQDGAIDDRTARTNLLPNMTRETERLIRLVNQLLLLARWDAGALTLDLLPLELDQLVRKRADHFSPLADQKALRVQIQAPVTTSGYQVAADRNRTGQVIDNLLDNAIRYAPPGSTITISLINQGEQILCSVEDSGPGIPPEDLPKIFDRFYRVEAARDRRTGGSGLGLAIAKALIEAQGGQITASSQIGQATRISFSLPARKLPEN